jgi:hypothetical protein
MPQCPQQTIVNPREAVDRQEVGQRLSASQYARKNLVRHGGPVIHQHSGSLIQHGQARVL